MSDDFSHDLDAERGLAGHLRAHGDEVGAHGETLVARTAGRVGHGPIGEVVETAVKRIIGAFAHGTANAFKKFLHGAAEVVEHNVKELEKTEAEVSHNFGSIGHEHPNVHAHGGIATAGHEPGSGGPHVAPASGGLSHPKPSEIYPYTSPGGHYTIHGQAQLDSSMYPGVSAGRHFQDANRQLHAAIQADPAYGAHLDSIAPGTTSGAQPGARGAYPRRPPTNHWTWHHHPSKEGVLELISQADHQQPAPGASELHPGGKGGMENWGGGRG